MKYYVLAFQFCFIFNLTAQEYERYDNQDESQESEESRYRGNLIEFDGSSNIQNKRKSREEEQYSIGVLQYHLPREREKNTDDAAREDSQTPYDNQQGLNNNDIQTGEVVNDPTPPPPSEPDLPINTYLGTLAFFMLVLGAYGLRNR